MSSKVNKKIYGLVIKLLILFASFGFIYHQISSKESIESIFTFIKSNIFTDTKFLVFILILSCFTLLNWGIETIKWRLLISKIEKLPFLRAYKAVFAGITIGIFTPNKTGEFAGRVLSIQKASRWEAAVISFIGSIAQLLATLVIGITALLVAVFFFEFEAFDMSLYIKWGLLFFSIALYVLAFALYLNIKIVSLYLKKIKSKTLYKIVTYAQVFNKYSSYELFKVLALSIIRYFVFSFQLVYIFKFLDIDIPIHHLICITSIWFFIITIIPTIALTEIGIRGAVSIFLFEFYLEMNASEIFIQHMELKVLTASFILWIANIIIPAIIGSAFILQFNIFKKANNGN